MKNISSVMTVLALTVCGLIAHPHPKAPQTKLEHLMVAAEHLEAGGAVREAASLRKHVAVLQENEKAKAATQNEGQANAKPAAVSKPIEVVIEQGKDGKQAHLGAIVGANAGANTSGEALDTSKVAEAEAAKPKQAAKPECCADTALKNRVAALAAGATEENAENAEVKPATDEGQKERCEKCKENCECAKCQGKKDASVKKGCDKANCKKDNCEKRGCESCQKVIEHLESIDSTLKAMLEKMD